MTLRHMKIFLSICNQNYNTTKAAESLHMTQPAVSLAIKELEQYYGVVLFDRIGRRLRITEAGQHMLEYAAHISSLFDDMEKSLKNWDSFGVLRVGSSITIGYQFLPNYVKTFYERFPGTEVQAYIAPTESLEQKIMANELDFALIEGIAHNPSILSEKYMDDHLVVIASADSEFHQGQTLSIEEFKNQKLLLREPGSGTREVFERAIAKADCSVSPIWQSTSTTALINATVNNLGIAVVPYRRVTEHLRHDVIITLKIDGLDFRRGFHIIHHKDKFLTKSAKAFIDLCRHYEHEHPMI